MILKMYDHYLSLKERRGDDFAALYFDLWFEFWIDCGYNPVLQCLSAYKYSFYKPF